MSAPALSVVAERVADRLRVVGPRMAARSSAEAAALLDDVRAVLQQLADLAAGAGAGAGAGIENRARRTVPTLAAHGLADQVQVLVLEVTRTGDTVAVATAAAILHDLSRRI